MAIKHIVLSGGSYKGLYTLGALHRLSQKDFYKMKNIESIFATSIGSVLGAILQLNLDWDDVLEYVIKRPWYKTFKPNADAIFEIMGKKGFLNIDILISILEKLFIVKELSLETLTLKEFFEFSHVDFHIFTVKLNTFTIEEFTYQTHPEMKLIEAIYMSCSIPLVFQPHYFEDSYRIDGGVLCNLPLQQCLDKYPNKEEIMSIHIKSDKVQKELTENTSFLVYCYYLFESLVRHSNKDVASAEIPNYIIIPCKGTATATLETLIKEENERDKFIDEGRKFADLFLSYKSSQSSMQKLG